MFNIKQFIEVIWNRYLQFEEQDQEVQLTSAVELRDYFTAEAQRIADEAGIELPDPCNPE
jgi:hypothetical protein